MSVINCDRLVIYLFIYLFIYSFTFATENKYRRKKMKNRYILLLRLHNSQGRKSYKKKFKIKCNIK